MPPLFHTHPIVRPSLQDWISAFVLFVACLLLFTQKNDFPFYYHPDEAGKVRQIKSAEWNYHHPMLMLSTARAALLLTSDDPANEKPQRVVEMGRWISATFCAAAVVLFAMMVWVIAGPVAAMIAGVLMMTNRQFFELSHYFKEDTSLLFGMACWFLALAVYLKKPHLWGALLVGAGAGLATSGKFVGAFTIALSLLLVPLGIAHGKRWKALGLFALGLIALYVVCNLPIFTNFADFRGGLDREVELVVKGHRGVTRSVPHSAYFTAFQKNVHLLLWVPLFWYYARCWKKRRTLTLLDWTVAIFPIAYMTLLSFSPKENDRYFLPATALFLCAVGMGVNRLARRWPHQPPNWLPVQTVKNLSGIWPRRLTLWSLVAGVVLIQMPTLVEYYNGFRRDDIKDLTAWLNEHLPNATLAIDRKVILPNERLDEFLPWQEPLKAKVLKRQIERFQDIDELREAGVTHVVVSESTYGRYDPDRLQPQKGHESRFEKNLRLYKALRDPRGLLWARARETIIYLRPGLEVYKLPEVVE